MILALGIVAGPASAAVFEGSQTDPTGDVVIAALPTVDLPNGGPTRIGFGSMDLSGASVSYDSGAGLLSITFSGTNFVQTHSGTTFHGSINSTAHQPAGSSQPCLLGGGLDDLRFTGSSSTGSGGGPGRGGATLWIPSTPGGILDTALTGTASFPVDWPEINQVVKFTFLDARLAHHAYLCATGFLANYADHGDRNSDDIRPFCIVAGCFDPLGSATPPPAPPLLELSAPTLGASSYTRGSTIRAAAELKNTNPSTIAIARAVITARPPGSTHAFGPIKYDFPADVKDISLGSGAVRAVSQSFSLPSSAPLGRYDVYLTYQDAGGLYHDGPSSFFDVTTAGGGTAAGGGGTSIGQGQPFVVSVAGGLRVRVARIRGGLRALRSGGLRVPITCSTGCEVSGRLLYRSRLVARGRVARLHGGKTVLALRTSTQGKKVLRGLRSPKLALKLRIADGDGHVRTLVRGLQLR